MAQANRLSHDFPGYPGLDERAARAGLFFSKVGENVAKSETFVLRFFHDALMASPEHRENILDTEFTHLGIGIEKSGATYYVTQEFAGLFDPLPPLAMEREMEAKLSIRFKGRMVLPESAEAEMRELCRRESSLFLQGRSQGQLPGSFGSASIITLNYTDMKTGLLRLLGEVQGSRPLHWSLGVAFGRNAKCPGGAYAMSLMLFPDLRNALDAADDLDGSLFASLARIRSTARSPHLDALAGKIARSYHLSPTSIIPVKRDCSNFFVYQTTELQAVPADVVHQIARDINIRSTGIHVFYPLAEGWPGNYFIVAILGDK
jgi:hypothetical protein